MYICILHVSTPSNHRDVTHSQEYYTSEAQALQARVFSTSQETEFFVSHLGGKLD